jgi:hypothetical protein
VTTVLAADPKVSWRRRGALAIHDARVIVVDEACFVRESSQQPGRTTPCYLCDSINCAIMH